MGQIFHDKFINNECILKEIIEVLSVQRSMIPFRSLKIDNPSFDFSRTTDENWVPKTCLIKWYNSFISVQLCAVWIFSEMPIHNCFFYLRLSLAGMRILPTWEMAKVTFLRHLMPRGTSDEVFCPRGVL